MTFDELFQSYVDYGFTKPVTPITYGTGIASLPVVNQMSTPLVSDIQTNERDDRVSTTVTPTSPSTGKMSFSGIAQAIGFAMNPAMGIANIATQQMTGKSIAENIMDAIGAMRGRTGPTDPGVVSMDPNTGVPVGVEASEGAVSPDASAGGAAGAAAASAAGSNDSGDTGGPFAKGGIVLSRNELRMRNNSRGNF